MQQNTKEAIINFLIVSIFFITIYIIDNICKIQNISLFSKKIKPIVDNIDW